jgi:uncharacterized protein (DUF736 family)
VEKQKDIGAMWNREAKSGLAYMTGSIEIKGERHEIVVFRNDKGGNDKRPDWKIYPATPREQKETVPF